jgi:hypothetical protein
MAREIVAKQQQEIKTMRDAVSVGKSYAAQSPDQSHAQLSTRSAPTDDPIAADGIKMKIFR